MTLRTILAALTGLALLTACGTLSADHQRTALQVIEQLRAGNVITPEQAAALTQALLDSPGAAWWVELLQVLGSVGLALLGVRWQRGPVATTTERAARLLGSSNQQQPPAGV